MINVEVGVKNNCIVATDCGLSLACIKIYSILPADQSAVRNAGFELSYRNRRGEVTRWFLKSLNKVIKVGFQVRIVIGRR